MSIDDAIIVLLVDDDAEQRDYLTTKFLGACACRVLNAENTEEALELARKYDVDVVVSDYLMPGGGGTGVDLLKAVNTLEGKRPVMILTTGFAEFLPDEAFNQIATIFCKPFSADRLIGAVLEKLGRPFAHRGAA